MIPANANVNPNLLALDQKVGDFKFDLVPGLASDAFVKPNRFLDFNLGLVDSIKINPGLFTQKPEFESSYKGLVDGINDLSGQIDAKKAELSNPDLDPSKRMELSIEMQELMQMRLQMITITTNLLKTDHDSAQAVNNNLRA